MMLETFQALVLDKMEDVVEVGKRELRLSDLQENDLLIRVTYSSVNYKDALACTPNGNIVKRVPFVPGIDLAGVVVRSKDSRFREGDEVLATGFELGVSHNGGFSEYASISANWAVKLPQGLTLREAMIVGTAGFTAALSIHELQSSGIVPEKGPVLVTGATGGVGSMSVSILSKLGYEVVASTGKMEYASYLYELGASQVIARDTLIPDQPRTLDKQIWAGVVDCVGGKALGSILSRTQYAGAVAVSGLTGGIEWISSIFPYILRGVRLIGIDSVWTPMDTRVRIWERLDTDMKPNVLDSMCTEITLEQIPDQVSLLLQGISRGRIIVKL